MIKSYKNAKTRKVHETGKPKGFKGLDGEKAARVMDLLVYASAVSELPALASYRLHKLTKDRKGQFSITVNLPWTVCFTPDKEGDFLNVEITDYH